ncbi:MAG: translocation/assembly module TamB domain-containing protein [Acidisphaera sp.]|nr:translocation/assembly module TamB domain-containing protein [Acidisphaera sp.]
MTRPTPKHILKWLAGIVGALVLLPILLVGLVLVVLNLPPGQRLAEGLVGRFTGGQVVVVGLSGWFPDAPRIAHLEIRDSGGAWLTIDDLALDWSALRLVGGDAAIRRLAVARVAVARLPESHPSPGPAHPQQKSSGLPVRVDVDALRIGRLDLGAPVAGTAASVSIEGDAHLASLTQGEADVTIQRLDGAGRYTLSGRVDAARVSAAIAAQEPAHGMVASLARLPDLGALDLQAKLDGPWNAAGVTLALVAGAARADARGRIDVTDQTADLDVMASAPAMTPAPDVSWQGIALDAHVHGPFTRPAAKGTLRVDALAAAGAGVRQLAADIAGDAGRVTLHAEAQGLRLPGPKPDLLEAAPLVLQADARLDAPTRPVSFTITHPLLAVQGSAQTAGAMQGEVALRLPDLSPYAAIGGFDLHGGTALTIKAAMQGAVTQATIDGTLDVTGGMAPIPGLLGHATLGVSAALRGPDVTLSRLALDGRTLHLAANGGLAAGRIDLDWSLALADLRVLAPSLAGTLDAKGRVAGPREDFSASADITGEVAAQGLPRGPIKVALQASGLPGAPAGRVTATGALDRAPLALVAAAQRAADGTLAVTLDRADWKSAHAEGRFTLAAGATLPQGRLALRMTRLDDLQPLLGRPLAGSVEAGVDLPASGRVRLTVQATGAGLPGTAQVGRASLTADIADPTTHPLVDARLTADGIAAGGITGSAQLEARGPQQALALKLTAALQNVQGTDAQVATAATLDVPAKTLALGAVQASWKTATLRLLAPARLTFGNGVAVDRLRLGLNQAVLEVSGQATPTLNLTASVRNVTPDLAKIVDPALDAAGLVQADAHLTGTPARPAGTVRLTATGLHMRQGPGRALPPADLAVSATLGGTGTRIDARLNAGASTHLTVTGAAPLGAGPLDLRAGGAVDLALLNPILTAQGRRVLGQVTLDATVAGSTAAPRIAGTMQLANGEVQDFAQGVHLTAMQATLAASGDTLRISRFVATAGPGTIGASGSIGVLAPGMPVDVAVTARNARPLASDLLTALIDMNLTVRGQALGQLAAAGSVLIHRADIQVPETMPVSVAVLDVRLPGQKPPPPPAPGPDIALDLTLAAPQGVFVRGRGLDAELGGTMRVRGTAAHPLPSGGFQMRRGTFSLAGTTLTFSTGEVTFNGASRIDPTLHFVAVSTSGGVTATLTVGGYASHPTITLSSVPDLPQDEVLAHLLFNQSAASLSPFQYAEIAAALAQMTGVTGGGDPLAGLRKGLGLDRLTVGSGANPLLPGQTANEQSTAKSAPAVEAGRYIAQGVYVGAKQGTSGAETQATVQIDITKGLKLETDVGSGSGANNVGLTYQFEY